MGIEVDEEGIKENMYDGRWETPRVSFADDHSFGCLLYTSKWATGVLR